MAETESCLIKYKKKGFFSQLFNCEKNQVLLLAASELFFHKRSAYVFYHFRCKKKKSITQAVVILSRPLTQSKQFTSAISSSADNFFGVYNILLFIIYKTTLKILFLLFSLLFILLNILKMVAITIPSEYGYVSIAQLKK